MVCAYAEKQYLIRGPAFSPYLSEFLQNNNSLPPTEIESGGIRLLCLISLVKQSLSLDLNGRSRPRDSFPHSE